MNIQPRISVIIICYKQEELIKRAIDSLLVQKEFIYEICVSDDCSPDNTWNVLSEYDRKYPGLFKLHRNNPNVGIFENIEYTWSMPTGDIIYYLAGDDVAGDGIFKHLVDYIEHRAIDYKNEKFCVFTDYQCIYPNGDTYTYHNRYAESNISRLKLYERGILANRGVFYSINILKQFIKVSQGRSYIAENAQDCQIHIFSDSAYYLPEVGNIYYANIGVSASMSAERAKEHEGTMVYAFNFFKSIGIYIDSKDIALPDYNIARKHFIADKTIRNYFRMVNAYFRCFDITVSFKSIDIRRFMFRIVRRLPHNKPLNW